MLLVALLGSARADLAREAPPSDESSSVADSRATLIIVSSLGGEAELRALLRELLERQSISCEFSEALEFDPNLLFSAPAHDESVQVFLVLSKKDARLYFRGPGGQRFLLRRLILPNALDEVGRELVAQVVESSTRALLYSSEGLDRTQASREIEREIEREARASRPSVTSPAEPPRTPPPPQSSSDSRAMLAFALGARYMARYAGSTLGLVHGPGIELGFLRQSRWLLRVRGSMDRLFEQTLAIDGIAAKEQSYLLRGAIDFGAALEAGSPLHASLGLGGGVDRVHFTPTRATTPELRLAPESTSLVFVLRPELRFELWTMPFVLSLGAWLDIPLVDTHYDVSEGDTQRTLATPWPVQPGALLGVGFQP